VSENLTPNQVSSTEADEEEVVSGFLTDEIDLDHCLLLFINTDDCGVHFGLVPRQKPAYTVRPGLPLPAGGGREWWHFVEKASLVDFKLSISIYDGE
jgi:hypothetical protein